jgi:hypothetical protein
MQGLDMGTSAAEFSLGDIDFSYFPLLSVLPLSLTLLTLLGAYPHNA